MEFKYRNVNDAFYDLCRFVHKRSYGLVDSPSRYGDVVRFVEPVMVQYERPWQRVLFNAARDCNPFFHLYESMWMLAGQRSVAPLAWYNSKMAEFSDDGKVFHGAYGCRWREWFGYDQLDAIVDELKKNPTSRRVVLQMWDPTVEPPHACTPWSDPYKAVNGGKDVPCNTQAYFAIREEKVPHNWTPENLQRKIDQEYEMAGCARHDNDKADEARRYKLIELYRQGFQGAKQFLDMTVCNRSNDMIWGMLGANVVHFSFLQEYLAARIGVEVGNYYQFTNNLHVYTERWTPEKWLADEYEDPYCWNGFGSPPLVTNPDRFDTECTTFVNHGYGDELDKLSTASHLWTNSFFPTVAIPMALAFAAHKRRDYASANQLVRQVAADDWQWAGLDWIERREANWLAKGGK